MSSPIKFEFIGIQREGKDGRFYSSHFAFQLTDEDTGCYYIKKISDNWLDATPRKILDYVIDQHDDHHVNWVGCIIENGGFMYKGKFYPVNHEGKFDPPTQWVNVYSVTREYGGAEEGGWYYHHFEPIFSVEVPTSEAEDKEEELLKEYSEIKEGDIFSVLGGTALAVYIEDEKEESATRERPHYE